MAVGSALRVIECPGWPASDWPLCTQLAFFTPAADDLQVFLEWFSPARCHGDGLSTLRLLTCLCTGPGCPGGCPGLPLELCC